jgi:hypothetical protein
MKKINPAIYVAVTLGVISVCMQPSLASTLSDWKPNLSEKILLLPPQHLEQAIDNDFSKSLLAQDLSDIDQQLSNQVSHIQSLQDAETQYSGEENIEIRHQILEGKKSYVELMGAQLDLKRERLTTKLNYLKRLMNKAKRKGARLEETSELRALQENAVQRANAAENTLRDDLFETSLGEESKFSQHYAKNKQAIAQLRSLIESHPMNSQLSSVGPDSTVGHLNNLILSADAELAVIDMESEILGYMARVLALDAMALAEDVAIVSYGGEGLPEPFNFNEPAEGLQLFLN